MSILVAGDGGPRRDENICGDTLRSECMEEEEEEEEDVDYDSGQKGLPELKVWNVSFGAVFF